MGRILIVDDEPHMRRILATNLARDGHSVTEAAGVSQATDHLAMNDYDAVITDQKMPDGEGLDVLKTARESDPAVSVVFLTAFATVELAVESMRGGAFDFITKPFQPEVVRATAKRACEHTTLLRENGVWRETVLRLEGSADIHGTSAGILAVREQIARVASTNATVLITGETGTGKELVARAIHKSSLRAEKPFVAVNCAAFTDTLLESELFGHERGAFTGADRTRQGLFEAAHEGTLFLDELGEMSLAAQSKLLRVLSDGQVSRVGSNKARHVDVRLLAATHRDLQQRVHEGSFREDLYYRIAVVPIRIPPLRERLEDLPILCELIADRVATELKIRKRSIAPAALKKMKNYAFPGNVRELRNLIERALILSSSAEVGPQDILIQESPDPAGPPAAKLEGWIAGLQEAVNLREVLESVEARLIVRALESAGGVQAEAARRLQLSRSDLGYKIAKFQIKNAGG